ncbi:MAG: hypothetical protein K1Y01_19730 [Vicinamibacteria bacterium]|nr:hypothetical protein [Vicinamibacteria bacterium]
MPALESAFEFLFKYPRSVFEAGDLGIWGSGSGSLLLPAVVVLTAGALSAWSYARLGARRVLRGRDVALLGGLRALALALLAVSLLDPTLRVLTVAPQQTFVGVLIDDSASLTIRDDDGRARAAFAQERLLDPAGDVRRALEQKFKVRFFRFSDVARRIQGETLAFSGARTNLAAALRTVREELADVPTSGLVLVTDGADNVAGPLSETLLDLRTRQLPVFPVGLGRERFDRDIEIARVEVPAAVLQGSSVVASLSIKAAGAGRGPLNLTVEDSSRVLSAQEVPVTAADSSTVRISIRADEPGPRLLRFKVAPIAGEQVAENNQFDVALDVIGGREKILYFEGAARFEAKFLRRAVQDDRNLQVVTLERTAENKFLRLAVDGAEELAAGFPRTREELFSYRGLVLGGVEASFFSVDQIRMLSDFVSQRGGGLLMLGSDKTFGEGGYAGTAVAEALPVALDAKDAIDSAPADATRAKDERFQWLKVSVTPLGASQPVTQLAANESDNEARFKALPPLSSVNRVTRIKPGASALLAGNSVGDSPAEDRVVLAFHRYGRGRAFAFPVQDSWRWQMHADVSVDDASHETFWRQMLRQLVNGVSGPVSATLSAGLVEAGSTVAIRADVADETFIRVNDASVTATIQTPSGLVREAALHWTVDKDGEYVGEFRAEERGVHEVKITARRAGAVLGEDVAHVRVDDLQVEFRDAEMRGDLLRRIAAETGGRFYTPDTVSRLAEDLTYSPKTASVVDEKELWDMPALFLGILFALSMEWIYRKFRGLA